MRKLLKKQEGFTLVELLAVIVILAIIAAIAIPAIGHIINSSREKAEVNDALQIIDAAKLYVTDHSDYTSGTPLDSTALGPYLNGGHSDFTAITATTDSNGNTTYVITGHKDIVSGGGTTEPSAALLSTETASESSLNSWLKSN
jgi:type IV pilus assembly protein PilA